MFGYIRTYKPELKMREYDMYQAAYCGLCKSLRENFGLAAGAVLRYDLVFLMLLTEDTPPKTKTIICPISLKKKTALTLPASAKIAAVNIILAYHKLRDDILDEKGFEKAKAFAASKLISRSYRKSRALLPQYDSEAVMRLNNLTVLESDESASVDARADTFASLMKAAAEIREDRTDKTKRCYEQILYHLGRIIYILDLVEDNDKPLVSLERTETGVNGSMNLIRSAFELLPETEYSGIIRNIIYFGLPDIVNTVFHGGKVSKK